MDNYTKEYLVLLTFCLGFCFLFSGIIRFFIKETTPEINALITMIGFCLITLSEIFDFGIKTSEANK